ncbi:MAG: hypothetical protein JO366_14710 [Methylobacteriaceae bacterium]|nr:hypothetical protein [Methylobacteriaceae bacterium]MBV9246056.1 hypothetical protein [Methylobacteriaceae bacterium]MBV9633173.1 hypothetical protein [Methylobacteriaceae bacterium]MBV9704770.1 hypothetical protein [Methylobacteriaceae bacterium]
MPSRRGAGVPDCAALHPGYRLFLGPAVPAIGRLAPPGVLTLVFLGWS